MHDSYSFEQPTLLIDYFAGGTRYVLPRRQLAGVRHVGWLLCGFGGLATAFMIGWMWMPIASGIEDLQQQKQQGFGWMSIAFGCFGILGLIPALGIVISGLAVVFNRTSCVVDLRGGVLKTTERLLLARWRRKREAEDIMRLRVALASEWKEQVKDDDIRRWLGESEAALVAETSDGKDFLVAVAYPREMLLQLAKDLAPRLEAEVMTGAAVIDRDLLHVAEAGSAGRTIDIVEGPTESNKIIVPDQPADSIALIERRQYGITITIPPVGIWKGSRGLMFFAVIWNGFISIFVAAIVLSLFGVGDVEMEGNPLLGVLFMIPFVGVGVGVALAAVNMGRRHAMIATEDNQMFIVRHSIFGKSTKEWMAEDIREICVGNSGMEVNDVPIKELQIHAREGNKFGCLSQLDDDELAWIAGELNQALQLNASTS